MKISGISKFTHLSASETELNFGEVLVGASNTTRAPTEKEFVLRNRSLVRASFRIANVESDHDPRFFFSPLHGVVDAESSVSIKVRYTPLSAGTFTCDHFDVLTPGGNRVRITCKGRATGPVLSLWRKNPESNFVPTRSVNFQDVAVGASRTSRAITLRNESPLEVFFHFDAQSNGVFQFDQINGKIPPFLDVNVTISFLPPHPGNFYRRFYLLIHNQSTRFVDVLGTGYDEKTRPSPFQQAHVDAYRLRVAAGLSRLSPDQLERYHEENGDALFLQGARRLAKAEDALSSNPSSDQTALATVPPPSQILTRSGEASLADIEVCSEYFVNIEDKANPVVVLGAVLDFGSCGIVQFPSKKLLHVTNNTHSKVTCSWRVAVASSPTEVTDEALNVFQVFPQSSDIAAGATAEFRVAFQPSRVNTYYFAELEAFVAFKSNRTFRLVNVDTFTPPWCVVPKLCGNTFASSSEQFLSKIRFRLAKNKVHFPPCFLGDSVFQTVLMENASDTPALFAFVEDPTEVFHCKPMCGYIAAKSFHLVAIRFTPRNVRKYAQFLQCVVNNAHSKPELLELTGICSLPQLSFQDILAVDAVRPEARVFVKPTAIGLQSFKQLELLNTSRVPLVYRWELPPKAQGIFRVTPKLGRLNGRETATIECCFTPDEIREYASRFLVSVKSISVPLDQRKTVRSKLPTIQELTLRVQTKGTIGAILFQPETLKFDTILVNTSAKQSFFLVNTADCDLMYSLRQSVKATTQGEDAGSDEKTTGFAGKLVFSEGQGCIPAQSRKQITATFFPTVAATFIFSVSAVIGDETQTSSSPYDTWGFQQLKQATCVIQAEASFPTIEIQDLRVPGLSTQLAWHQFQCNEINQYLSAPLSKADETPRRSAPESEAESPAKCFILPFSPAPLGSRTERVFFKLCNPGNLVVQYHLRYPKEGNVEIEHWAETGAPSTEEVRLNAIIDSKVFGISPRRATLLPQQSVVLTLSYSYTSEAYGGIHHLPMLLEVEKGKQVVLELQGRTLTHKDPKLFLPTRVFHLSPVTIGEYRRGFRQSSALTANRDTAKYEEEKQRLRLGGPPAQQIEVFNRGDSAMRLEVESAAFQCVNAANFDYPVLICRSNSEIIPAKSSIFLDLEFNPIQAGTVEAKLALKAHGLMGKSYLEVVEITIVATGFHPKQWTLSQIWSERQVAMTPPKLQSLSIPDLPASFVSDYVDFGHVAMHSQVNQLLVLQNESRSAKTPEGSSLGPRSFVFEWDATHPLVADGTITFVPKRGELGPGEKALIRASIRASGDALVVNHDVACLVVYSDESSDARGSTSAVSPASPTRFSGPQLSSGSLRSNNDSKAADVRVSVINRSIATQEAVAEHPRGKPAPTGDSSSNDRSVSPSPSPTAQRSSRSSSRKSLLPSKPTRKSSPEKGSALGSSESRKLETLAAVEQRATPLFVRIYAHVLPLTVMERIYPRSQVKKLPLLTTKQLPRSLQPVIAAVATTRSTTPQSNSNGRGGSGKAKAGRPATSKAGGSTGLENEAAAPRCRDVLFDVLEALVVDALTSSTVQEAMEQQLTPLSRCDRALKHAWTSDLPSATRQPPTPLYPKARQSDDCQTIVSDVMENTVLNILQELFHGDLERELLCVPRKTVFPSVPGPNVASLRPANSSSTNNSDSSPRGKPVHKN
ncbi:hypothetical protein BBJ28_00006239 [Nothophytophthora sp. Chile5]|nr:hypothetical protein BBJ28_00006239 [Nothophytophthora sp. Chile5]